MVSYDILVNGLCKESGLPVFGSQHLGISPGGAMDQFSFKMGNALLGNPLGKPALEIVIAPRIRFNKDCWFVLTGARYDKVTLKRDEGLRGEKSVEHGRVQWAECGNILEFGNKTVGFRSYLCNREAGQTDQGIEGRQQPDIRQLYNWKDSGNVIRVIEGPEYKYLEDGEQFTGIPWKISNEFSEMGIRLSCSSVIPAISLKNMISEAVADGTVQLTPTGPIILLRYRQTVGGYPRIYNVISADIDILAQYYPNQILRFKKVSLDEAATINKAKLTALEKCCL